MSTEISASAVMQLREKTGAGMMDCKKALAEAGGDTEKAIEILRQKGLKKSAEKADRVAKEGIVLASVNDAKNAGVMIEMNCETDFVARNADFVAFANKVLDEVRKAKPANVDAFLNASASFSNGKSVGDSIAELTGKIGEKIAFKRFTTVDAASGVIADYIHPGNKLGVLVQLEIEHYDASVQADAYSLARDIAMQTAAMSPMYVNRTEVPQELLEKEMAILREQGKNEGKPEKVLENIIKGRLEKYLQEICLVEQIFVKDSSKTIKELVNDFGKKIGKKVAVQKFERFRLGD
ncbi:translation elongation factor Ts [bacterium]|nr:translation elongation factor Ts [bacterium]